MATLFPESESHLESIVFFLSESLIGAIGAGDRLQHRLCQSPHIRPGMDCEEIANELAEFRQAMQELWETELLLVAKIMRAGDLAKELRTLEPELKPEIDTFRLTSILAKDLREVLLPDAQAVFDRAIEPKSYLESRGYCLESELARGGPLVGYKIAGRVDVRILLDACEAFHFCLAERYGVSSEETVQLPFLAEPQGPAVRDDNEDETLLLSDLGEIISDPFASYFRDLAAKNAGQRLPN